VFRTQWGYDGLKCKRYLCIVEKIREIVGMRISDPKPKNSSFDWYRNVGRVKVWKTYILGGPVIGGYVIAVVMCL